MARVARSFVGRVLGLPGAGRLVPVGAALVLGGTALTVLQWSLVAHLVAGLVARRTTPAAALGVLVGLLLAWSARAALTATRERHAAAVSARVRHDLRLTLVRSLVRRGPAAVDGERAGELVSTATEAVSALDAVLARFVPSSVAAAVGAPALAVAVLVLDPLSGLLLLVTGPLVVVLLWLIGTHADRAARERWESLGRLGALLVDTVRVLPTLVTFGRGPASVRWLGGVGEAYRAATMRVLRKAFLSGFVLELGASLSTALVAVTVGIRLFEGELTLQRALLVLLLAPEFFAPLRALGADHHARLEAAPAAGRLFALLDAPQPVRGTARPPAAAPRLRLVGVGVRHDGRDVLADVDLDLPAGSRTALVGPSGAGKSTVATLLLGFREPDAGTVLVDDVPLTDLDPDAWRSRVAYVSERPWLLAGTLADNVRAGRPGASDDEVLEALRRAQALELVGSLPDGVRTVLGEDGARLSGGERLRVALARALVADATVVVLDEPTSQLDPATEAALLCALDELGRDRTVLTITHRRAPLAHVDRVVRLEDGRVLVPEGSR